MARMDCKCGEILSTSAAPNDIQLRVYTDREWDSILEVDVIDLKKFPLPTHDVCRCPKCERVYVFTGEGLKVYKLEE
ncbi:MAG: hypothetical protein FWC91_12110 [Defluviitaleaceae bacterium]|nr:hypothetical protein [Defluviitaleaceae bacterium]